DRRARGRHRAAADAHARQRGRRRVDPHGRTRRRQYVPRPHLRIPDRDPDGDRAGRAARGRRAVWNSAGEDRGEDRVPDGGTNPLALAVAQPLVGVPVFSGAGFRAALFALFLPLGIWYLFSRTRIERVVVATARGGGSAPASRVGVQLTARHR